MKQPEEAYETTVVHPLQVEVEGIDYLADKYGKDVKKMPDGMYAFTRKIREG